jgi:GNAT superfamily N-acetyltransferase
VGLETPIVRLAEAQFGAAADVLGRAFADDPIFVQMVPDAARRARMVPLFMLASVRFCHRYGANYVTAGDVRGVAAWNAPDQESTRERWMAAGYDAVIAAMTDDDRERMGAIFGDMGEVRRRVMPVPNWYLIVIGVEPALQGQGIGGQLLQPILARADAAGIPCYLETATALDVRFYTRHGFGVVYEGDVPGVHLHYWTMRRPARASTTAEGPLRE